ncbi:unnamed protein product [Diatraea saccharalis]|uniref:CRAL-TRIO domain-containing protein n=1 Tax=Diatraea saccharalis TaxID=40085 RepID=A0A9N9R838_9NEOP|nr:unnamed protein product [Diatraea saccharalis]
MECLPDIPLLKFHPDTLQYVRETYNLAQPGAMDEAVDILELWVLKQQHFTKKDFNRDYLERTIIRAKGSVERAKERIDKICTSRTQVPQFFTDLDPRTPLLAEAQDAFLPKLTKDNYRIYLINNNVKDFGPEVHEAFYKRFFSMWEYICAYDYPCGIIIILDFRPTNLFEFTKYLNIADLGHVFNLIFTGYGFRLKGMYMMTTSKLVDSVLKIFKQVVNKKIADRIQSIKNLEELYDYVDRDILPEEYGGKEVSITELHKKWIDALDSKEFNAHITNMYQAKTIEELRMKDGGKSEHLGIPGTFRALNMD